MGEQELGGKAGARMWKRSPRSAGGDDAVDEDEGLVVERNHPFRVELAQRDLQPGTVAGNLVHAVELEVQQLPDAKPARSGQQQGVRSKSKLRCRQRVGEPPVAIDRQVAGK